MAQSRTLYFYQHLAFAGAFQFKFLDNHWFGIGIGQRFLHLV